MFQKLFRRNLISVLAAMLIPLIVLSAFSIWLVYRQYHFQLRESTQSTSELLSSSMESFLEELNNVALSNSSNSHNIPVIRQILRRGPVDPDTLTKLSLIRTGIMSQVNARPYLHSIYIYTNNEKENYLSTNLGLLSAFSSADSGWLTYYREHTPNSQELVARKMRQYAFEEEIDVFSLFQPIIDHETSAVIGVVVVNLKSSYLQNMVNRYATLPGQSVAVTNSAGELLLYSAELDKRLFAEGKNSLPDTAARPEALSFNGHTYYIQQSTGQYGLCYYTFTSLDNYDRLTGQMLCGALLLIFFCIILGTISVYCVSKKNSRGVHEIFNILANAEQGLPLQPSSMAQRDGYQYIINNILHTFLEKNQLQNQLADRKYALKSMELAALRSQINPHFIFNTLEIINGRAIRLSGGENDVSEMIGILSEIFRYALRSETDTVPLYEELQHTDNYVAIQKIHYKNAIDVEYLVDETLLDEPVLKLLFQPLIENAISHGLKDRVTHCRIRIRIVSRRDRVCISVVNNGRGMTPARLKEVRDSLTSSSYHSHHIGLFNTFRRLSLLYQTDFRFQVQSKEAFGTVISIEYPKESR